MTGGVSLRAFFYRPGEGVDAEPYARASVPLGTVTDDMLALLGGTLTVLRGGFPDQGSLRLSRPVPFRARDWVRVWLPGDAADGPTYLGECLGEPWPDGAGEVQLQGLWNAFKSCRWAGQAQGDFQVFFGAVLAQSDVPAWLGVRPLPDIDSQFSADVPFELLGDTVNAITPALGGYLIGVTAEGEVACVDPTLEVTHRFPVAFSERPAGGTQNYANCVRFTYEHPSGDTGYAEVVDSAEVAAVGGLRAWAVEQVTARELGLPAQPYWSLGGSVTRSVTPGGIPALKQDRVLTGLVFHDLSAAGIVAPTVSAAPAVAFPAGGTAELDALRTQLELDLRASVTFQQGIWQTAKASIAKSYPPGGINDGAAGNGLYQDGALRVGVNLTTLPGWSLVNTLRWGVSTTGDVSFITWRAKSGTSENRFNGVYSRSGSWQSVEGQPDTFMVDLDPNWIGDQTGQTARRFVLAYEPAFLDACRAAGVSVKPISWRGGGAINLSTVNGQLMLPLSPDATVIHPRLVLTPGGEYRPDVPWALLGKVGTAADDPVAKLAGVTALGEVLLITPDAALTLPFGSSVEVEVPDGGAVGDALALHSLNVPLAQAEAAKGAAGWPAGVRSAAMQTSPVQHTRLVKAQDTPDGWVRFAVRYPDTWDGQGEPPADMTVTHLLLGGVSNVGRIRVKTPQLGGLQSYGARLLRYRSKPMRDWRGRYRELRRVPALGVAAFEVPGQEDDDLLDVQRVTYDLNPGAATPVAVQAGSPLPVDDVDALGVVVDGIYRVIRRAGGVK